eukprot:TRINITY_DN2110_c0_g3_i2.p1 TRINITY_DN2110_c0_g3~~TRINITY_DN2110_c0_g3_i2.p1  ORF type:complete len:132 (+),score=34.83 TRINITY_DN2110_c0_g3_i2:155-550(+)
MDGNACMELKEAKIKEAEIKTEIEKLGVKIEELGVKIEKYSKEHEVRSNKLRKEVNIGDESAILEIIKLETPCIKWVAEQNRLRKAKKWLDIESDLTSEKKIEFYNEEEQEIGAFYFIFNSNVLQTMERRV